MKMDKKYYSIIFYDLFAEMFVTEKDPFAPPERYFEITRDKIYRIMKMEDAENEKAQ